MSDASTGDGTGAEGAEAVDTTTTETTAPAATQAGGDEKYDRILSRMDELGQFTNQMSGQWQEFMAAQQAEPEPDEGWLEPGEDGYDEEQEYRQLQELIRSEAREIAQQMVTPIQQERMAEMYDTRAQGVEKNYPDLIGQDGKPSELASSVMQTAWDNAQRFGIDSENDPKFWDLFEMSYKAHKADEYRQRETPAGGSTAVLESGGASAGNTQGAVDEQEEYIARLKAKSGDPFFS